MQIKSKELQDMSKNKIDVNQVVSVIQKVAKKLWKKPSITSYNFSNVPRLDSYVFSRVDDLVTQGDKHKEIFKRLEDISKRLDEIPNINSLSKEQIASMSQKEIEDVLISSMFKLKKRYPTRTAFEQLGTDHIIASMYPEYAEKILLPNSFKNMDMRTALMEGRTPFQELAQAQKNEVKRKVDETMKRIIKKDSYNPWLLGAGIAGVAGLAGLGTYLISRDIKNNKKQDNEKKG